MDTFASDMACVVRCLFPEDDELGGGGGANNKRKRNSVFAALSPSPLREIRNIPKSKGTDTTVRTSSTSKGFSSSPEAEEKPCLGKIEDSEIKKTLFVDGEVPYDDGAILNVVSKPPSEAFSERFANVLNHYPPDTYYLVIRDAVITTAREVKDSAEDVPLASLSMEEVNTIRVMIVTSKRQKVMNDMGRLVLGPIFERQQFNYGPGFWYSVLRGYSTFKQIYAAESDISRRFDLLFGFTHCLSKHTRWITHHGRLWGGEKMVAGLAMRWKHILKYNSNQLKLDDDFSLPAVLCFAEEFKTTVESAEMYGDPALRFDFA